MTKLLLSSWHKTWVWIKTSFVKQMKQIIFNVKQYCTYDYFFFFVIMFRKWCWRDMENRILKLLSTFMLNKIWSILFYSIYSIDRFRAKKIAMALGGNCAEILNFWQLLNNTIASQAKVKILSNFIFSHAFVAKNGEKRIIIEVTID